MAETLLGKKLGMTRKEKRIDGFFSEYVEYIRVRTSPNTVKRYRAAINAFLAFMNMFHSRVLKLSQIKQEHIEEYQLRRLDSIELKTAADGDLRERDVMLRQLVLRLLPRKGKGLIRAAEHGHLDQVRTYF